MKESKFEREIDGKKIIIETSKLARQADGAVSVRCGDTIVLVTAVASDEARTGVDFLPLTVDVEERMYAAGKIPGGFIKREGRPSEKSVLTARLIDRPLRPSFPKGFFYNIQVISTILSVDQINPFDVLALNGASCALTISDIPFNGPLAAVRVADVEGKWVINPTFAQLDNSSLDMVVAGNKEAVLMIEASSNILAEEQILDAIKTARSHLDQLIDFQLEIQKAVGKEKREVNLIKPAEAIETEVSNLATEKIKEAILETNKKLRSAKIGEVKKFVIEELVKEDSDADAERDVKLAFSALEKKLVREKITSGVRLDGRNLDEIRTLDAEAGILPRTRIHGSGLFTRGQTQALTVLTLGTVGEEQMLDGLGIEESKRYIHHYNFPPFSTGEAWPMRGPKRREIGHGALVEKALMPVIPDEETFPYTIRLVSDILESNGSSSMASVCGSTLALMDAGVPIKNPVSGIAMGLVKEGSNVAVLTDIAGEEDGYGDMDFKVAGTREGVSAIQMDMKISGIDETILEEALETARKARIAVLDVIENEISAPRPELSEFAPKVITIQIKPDKIREVIGSGGKIIKEIIDKTGAAIDIEQNGTVFISAKNAEAGEKAKTIIETIVKEIEPGEEFEGKVTKVVNFGAFVELAPGKEGLVHISKFGPGFVKDINDVVKEGDILKVRVIETDRAGKISLETVS